MLFGTVVSLSWLDFPTPFTNITEGSRANFAIASSFLMQLLVTSETAAESAEINDLVARWRWAMRIGSGSTGNGLMSLGLLRLDGLLLENGQQVGQQNQVGGDDRRGNIG